MLSNTTVIARGATVYFSTTFFDVNKNVVQPASATINIVFPTPTSGSDGNATISMTPPTLPATKWTALWDSRNTEPGTVSWSIHSSGSPYAVEDGFFVLSANPANLLTFL
jgi:hypothetical protein